MYQHTLALFSFFGLLLMTGCIWDFQEFPFSRNAHLEYENRFSSYAFPVKAYRTLIWTGLLQVSASVGQIYILKNSLSNSFIPYRFEKCFKYFWNSKEAMNIYYNICLYLIFFSRKITFMKLEGSIPS